MKFAIEQISDATQLRRAFGCFPSGVTALCAEVDGAPVGMAASSFTSVSISPALVSVCIQRSSTTWPKLRQRAIIGLSVLAEGQDALCRQLASRSVDRFAGIEWDAAASGAIFINGSIVIMECTVHEELLAGDHVIALLEVQGLHAKPETAPLVFHKSSYRRLAPT